MWLFIITFIIFLCLQKSIVFGEQSFVSNPDLHDSRQNIFIIILYIFILSYEYCTFAAGKKTLVDEN